MKLIKLFALLLVTVSAFAQKPVTATLNPVSKNGWHKIMLTPELRSYSKTDLGDFRIFDQQNVEVPYLLNSDVASTSTMTFETYQIISKTAIPNKSTEIIIANPKKQIDEISLFIGNSEVVKKYRISGSDDEQTWYGLIDNDSISNIKDHEKTSVIKTFVLPISSYRFLKIEFDDTKTLPINILKTGNFILNPSTSGNFIEIIPQKTNTENLKSQKKTRIHSTFPYYATVDKIEFAVSNPSLFKRRARIYTLETRKEKRREISYQNEIASFDLISDEKNIFNIAIDSTKEIFIEIDNGDNRPLTFSGIRYYQKPIYAIAELSKAETYTIKTGNPKLLPPQYDLAYFKDNISSELPVVTIKKIEIESVKTANESAQDFWQQSWFLWLCIAIGGIAIVWFTISFVKDLK